MSEHAPNVIKKLVFPKFPGPLTLPQKHPYYLLPLFVLNRHFPVCHFNSFVITLGFWGGLCVCLPREVQLTSYPKESTSD